MTTPTKMFLWVTVTTGLALTAMLCAPTKAHAQVQHPHNIPDFCNASVDTIPAGQTVTWTGTQSRACVAVKGTLVLATGASLTADNIMVYEGGFLDVQTGSTIIIRSGTISDTEQWNVGIFVFGRVRMLGTTKTPFVRVTADIAASASSVTLASAPVGWAAGDEVFIPDTRQTAEDDKFNANYVLRHEIRTIATISGSTLTFTTPLTFAHLGARDANGALSIVDGIPMLPHVANMTRSITVRSANPSGTRAHMVMTSRAQVEIRGTVFRDMGRTRAAALDSAPAGGGTNQIGRYPVHFHHLIGPPNPSNTGYQFQFVGNTVRDSLKWPVAIHNTSYGLVEGNVIIGGSQLTGAGIALEDGNEIENLIQGNFVGDIRGAVQPRDTMPSAANGEVPGSGGECIWAGGFYNRFVNNVVTGCRNHVQNIVAGVGFKFSTRPAAVTLTNPTARGVTTTVSAVPQRQPILQFDGNEAYGVMADGFTVWHLGTDGYSWNANQAESLLRNFRVWNAYESAYWLYPTVNVTMDGLIFRYNPATSPNNLVAVTTGDYRQVNQTLRNFNVHSAVWFGQDPIGTFRFDDITATTKVHAFQFRTPSTPGTQATHTGNPVTMFITRPNITAWPGFSLETISMSHNVSTSPFDTTSAYRVEVIDYQGGSDDFRVCYAIQASQALYGGTCSGLASRPEINGIIAGTVGPPPPVEICGNGIDDDGDGSTDEGCPVTPPPPPPDPGGVVTLPTFTVVNADVTVSGVQSTWNANTSTLGQVFPFDASRGTHATTTSIPNTANGTLALWFSVTASQLNALGQASAIPLVSLRPEPNPGNNISTSPQRGLEIYRGDPSQPPVLRAVAGQPTGTPNSPDSATSGPVNTFGSASTAIMTWTPTQLRVYVNGVLASTVTRSRPDYSVSNVRVYLAVGPHLIHSQDQQFLKGTTKDPIVYNAALSPAEVAGLHTAMGEGTTPPPPPPPVEVCGDGLDNDNDGQIDEGCTTPPPPTLNVTPTSIVWNYTTGGAAPSPATVSVTATNGSAFTTAESDNFYSNSCATPTTCPSGTTFTATPSAGFLSTVQPGTYTGTITVSASGVPSRTVSVSLVVVAPPVVSADAVVSDWSLASFGPWSACVNSIQTRSEIWTRTVITPATGNGTTPALSEPRTGQQACVNPEPPPPAPNVDAVVSPFVLTSFGPWSDCVNNTQTRDEIWTRTVITPASGTGITPHLSEPRTGTQGCLSPVPNPVPTGSIQLTLRNCQVPAVAVPPSNGRWRVQWFDNGVSFTNASTTYRRTLTLTPGAHAISLRWTRDGFDPVVTAAVNATCVLN